MTRFAICDTDAEFLEKLGRVLHKEFEPCTVEYMYGPSALEVSLRSDSGGADVLLSEIELRGENAIEIVKQFLSPTSPLQIIYMTSNMEYCTEVYDTKHCGFLIKPIKRQFLVRDIRRAQKQLEREKDNGVVVQRNGSLHIVSPSELLYIESHGHIVRVITEAESLETYERIATFLYQLDNRFLQCHKSYVINMERVRQYCGNSFVMDNGIAIPISQSRRKEVKNQFLNYFGNPMMYKQK